MITLRRRMKKTFSRTMIPAGTSIISPRKGTSHRILICREVMILI